VTEATAVRSRLQAAAARGLTRFVGREAEMDVLFKALEQARSGHGQVVAVVGEPGVGKSRLVWEFTHSHRTQGCLVLEARSVSFGKASTYLPVIDLLKGYFQIEPRDDARKIREKVTGKLLSLDRALESCLAPICWLLDVPTEEPEWEHLDAAVRRQRLRDGIRRVVFRESQVQPLVILFEDLHWIDGETQAFLDSLVESLPAARGLLLVNYRPEYTHGWGSKTYYSQVRLDALASASAEKLLQALLGTDPSVRPFSPVLITRTEGNPFFLEESVRTLVETGVLIGERGAYQLARPLEAIQVPATVQAVLAARIDRLDPEAKRLLQAAAVVGKDVPWALLEAVAELPEDALRNGLAQLQAAELLYEANLFPDLEYTFKHALTHEVAYGSVLHERRRALHAQLVEVIERVFADRIGEHIELLAHHALRGEAWSGAVVYLRRAAAKAIARGVYREATEYLEQALTALGHQPETSQTREAAIDLRLDLRVALLPLSRLDAVVRYLREAEPLATQLGDPRRLGWIWAYLCTNLWLAGDLPEALGVGERALELAERQNDFPLTIAASYYLGCACVDTGSYRRAATLYENIVRSLGDDLSRDRFGLVGSPVIQSRAFLAWLLAERGLFGEARVQAQEAVRLAEGQNQAWNVIVTHCWGSGRACALQGHLEEAVTHLERAAALADESGIALCAPLCGPHSGSSMRGLVELRRGCRFWRIVGPSTRLPAGGYIPASSRSTSPRAAC
jgi:predicted ATPase